MGLYDRLTFEDGLDLPTSALDVDPFGVTWQTKTIRRPAMENYKVTAEGRLYRERTDAETVPETKRPCYDPEIDGFESELQRVAGMFRTIHLGWTDVEYHGMVEIHRSVDGEYVSLDLKFTDGTLVDITRNMQ